MVVHIRKNLASGVIGLMFSITTWVIMLYQVPVKATDTFFTVNARYVPKFVLTVAFLLSLMLVLESLIKKNDKVIKIDLLQELRLFSFIAILIVYVILLGYIGFLASTLLMTVGSLLFIKDRNPLHYAITIVMTIAIYFVFSRYLGISLP